MGYRFLQSAQQRLGADVATGQRLGAGLSPRKPSVGVPENLSQRLSLSEVSLTQGRLIVTQSCAGRGYCANTQRKTMRYVPLEDT